MQTRDGHPLVTAEMSPAAIAFECGGFYESPRDATGNYTGPVVGYTGRYGVHKLQRVGFKYVNYAKIERWPALSQKFVAKPLVERLREKVAAIELLTFCGAPLGGMGIARDLAAVGNARYIFMEKNPVALATATAKARFELVFGRHEPNQGDQVVYSEDVCNHFSDTDTSIAKIESFGAKVVAIMCFLNRSMKHDKVFPYNGRSIPIISLWREPMPEYEQEEPEIAQLIADHYVVLDPKLQWDVLENHMRLNHRT